MECLRAHNKNYLNSMFPSVMSHQVKLQALNNWWDKVALVGKINSLNVPQSLLANMLETKAEFADLQAVLIDNMLTEQLQQCSRKQQAIAQTVIDIPNRNLFERTADVGFLATDVEIRYFLKQPQPSDNDIANLQQRLGEYSAKYSVYDDIILFDARGQQKVRLGNVALRSVEVDPVIAEVLQGKEEYYEVCRFSPLNPDKPLSSLFLAAIRDPESAQIIGVLCLSFRLADEMSALFADLQDDSALLLCLLDSRGNVLESNDHQRLPRGTNIPLQPSQQLITIAGQPFVSAIAPTRGYQGYQGLHWHGCALMPVNMNAQASVAATDTQQSSSRWQGFSPTLLRIQRRAGIVTDDLDLVVLNGRIAAARSDADEFIPILEEIRQIGRQMQSIFSESVTQLMSTVLSTQYQALKFQAQLAIDIMDRNLYERANDCRWWALTSLFSQCLKEPVTDSHASKEMTSILVYINSLYTVYTAIYIYNTEGTVVAVSHSSLADLVSNPVEQTTNWRGILALTDTQQYCVSEFKDMDCYQQRPTYVYNAAIRHDNQIVGGIGLVFDSEPQFRQMLDEVIDSSSEYRQGLYVERSGRVIAASQSSAWQPGDILTLPAHITEQPGGAQGAGIYHLGAEEYVVGFAVSKGYREYKTKDGYRNDIIALVLETNTSQA
ncbi:MAG: cache domain-containing protein [Alteromonadaceae bacterium]|nr:cache domain-containing protein [Alteromonadaceae bacterium]